jgi:MFS family permease
MISVLREIEPGHATRQDRSFQLGALLGVLRMRPVVFLLLFALVSNIWWWSFTTFAVTYFVKGRGLGIPEASFLMTLFFALGVFRNPSAGFLADRFGYYKPAIFSIAVDTLATFLIPRVATGFPVMGLLVLWGVLGEMSWISFNVFIAEVVPSRVAGAFFGLYNALGFFTGTAGPVLFGRVADIAGFGPFFDLALVIQVLSLVLAFGVRESRGRASQLSGVAG